MVMAHSSWSSLIADRKAHTHVHVCRVHWSRGFRPVLLKYDLPYCQSSCIATCISDPPSFAYLVSSSLRPLSVSPKSCPQNCDR